MRHPQDAISEADLYRLGDDDVDDYDDSLDDDEDEADDDEDDDEPTELDLSLGGEAG
jgi:hypothetical protein